MSVLMILAGIGFSLSLYTYFLEKRLAKDPLYKPVCDLSDRISCTKVIKSPYARPFFISNSLAGMIFYAVIESLTLLSAHTFVLIAACGGAFASIILAYILYVKIKALCPICTLLYLVNAGILIAALRITH